MHLTRRPRRLALVVLAALATLTLTPAVAWAHDYLISSDPTAGSTQQTPLDHVTLTFDDIVLQPIGNSTFVDVVGPHGRHYDTGCPAILDRTVTTPVALGGPGTYTVSWRIVSADGHPVDSSISFSYQPSTSAPQATGASAPRVCAATDTSTGSGSAANGGGSTLAVIIAVAIGVLTLAALTAILAGARRRNPQSTQEDPGTHP